MNKSLMIGLVGGAVAATALGGVAGYKALSEPTRADILGVEPVTEVVSVPKEVCRDVTVTERAPVQDENRIAGTAIGAVAGGLLGSQIGGGSGRTVATVAGLAAGGYAGNRVQKNMQESDTVTRTRTQCKTVNETHKETIGYDVRYKLGEVEGTVRMNEPPATDFIPVKDGVLQIDAANQATPPG
jgi:uncharacterized protein YcfJ